jgi:hypothetical protein
MAVHSCVLHNARSRDLATLPRLLNSKPEYRANTCRSRFTSPRVYDDGNKKETVLGWAYSFDAGVNQAPTVSVSLQEEPKSGHAQQKNCTKADRSKKLEDKDGDSEQ